MQRFVLLEASGLWRGSSAQQPSHFTLSASWRGEMSGNNPSNLFPLLRQEDITQHFYWYLLRFYLDWRQMGSRIYSSKTVTVCNCKEVDKWKPQRFRGLKCCVVDTDSCCITSSGNIKHVSLQRQEINKPDITAMTLACWSHLQTGTITLQGSENFKSEYSQIHLVWPEQSASFQEKGAGGTARF